MAGAWPKASTESCDWKDSWRTYEAAVLPPIVGLEVAEHLSAQEIAEVAAAQEAIVAFDELISRSFAGLALETADTILVRSEAASSSQIEHLTVSAKQLALAEYGASRSSNAKLVHANALAMADALADDTALTTRLANRMQAELLGETGLHLGLRREPVWIGTSGSSPVGADYVAPDHGRVSDSLEDLWRYLEQPARLPLAQIAVGHAQFENIHPYVDGNGRVGRALVHRYLRRAGLTGTVTVPISAGLLTDARGYVAALRALREGDPAPIVGEFTRATRDATAIGRELIDDLGGVRSSWQGRLTARSDSVAWRIADSLVGKPAINARIAAERFEVTPAAARTAIAALSEAGILRQASTGSRNRVWVAEEVTAAYDRIAVLIGRRRPY